MGTLQRGKKGERTKTFSGSCREGTEEKSRWTERRGFHAQPGLKRGWGVGERKSTGGKGRGDWRREKVCICEVPAFKSESERLEKIVHVPTPPAPGKKNPCGSSRKEIGIR